MNVRGAYSYGPVGKTRGLVVTTILGGDGTAITYTESVWKAQLTQSLLPGKISTLSLDAFFFKALRKRQAKRNGRRPTCVYLSPIFIPAMKLQ